jgi:hypothetical protein
MSSLSGCPDGRPHFAEGLGRGPYSPIGSSFPAIAEAEAEAGLGKFSFDVSIIVAVRFRFRILAG